MAPYLTFYVIFMLYHSVKKSSKAKQIWNFNGFCLFDLIFYIPVNNFQLCRDGSSWVEPVLSKDKRVLLKDTSQWHRWGSRLRPLGLE